MTDVSRMSAHEFCWFIFSFSLVGSGIKNGENYNILVKTPIYLYRRQDLALWLDNKLCQTSETDVNNS